MKHMSTVSGRKYHVAGRARGPVEAINFMDDRSVTKKHDFADRLPIMKRKRTPFDTGS